MPRCRIGTTIIDALKLCYMVNTEDLSVLMGLDYGHYDIIEDFMLFRASSQHFAYCFNILYGTDEDRMEVAQLRFRRYGEVATDVTYTFLHVFNHVLYDSALLNKVLKLPEKMGMVFHNITTIDLAKDFTQLNPVSIIRRMYKDKDITTIINGKAVMANLAKKQNDIERIEYNLSVAENAKIQEICSKQLAKVEAEREDQMKK